MSEYRVGDYRFDRSTGELRSGDGIVPLRGKPIELLIALIEAEGATVSREELYDRLWGLDHFIDHEGNLNATVRRLRAALGDDPADPRYVLTIPGQGYRLVAELVGPLDRSTGPTAGVATARTRRPLLALAAILLLAVVWTGNLGSDPEVTVAVEEFESYGFPEDKREVAPALSEDLLTHLAETAPPGMAVVVSAPSDRPARFVLQGAVRYFPDQHRLQILTRLVRTRDGRAVWSENRTYGCDDARLQEVRSRVARGVAAAIL